MANFNLNMVMLGGRLTADPELRTTPSGISVTSFTIAVNRKYAKEGEEKNADFFNVTAWRQTAEFICKFFRKGSSICVRGSIENRSWTDEQGIKRFGTNIVADEAYFVDAKGDATAAAQPGAYAPQYQQPYQQPAPQPGSYMPQTYQQPAPAPVAPQFEELSDSDELPF